MDALAGLAFGIVVIDVIRGAGRDGARRGGKEHGAGRDISSILMAVIYVLVSVMGTQSTGELEVSSNGGEALARIAESYFGGGGAFILAVIVTVALPKDSGGADHKLWGGLCGNVPGRSLPTMSGR